MTKLPDIVGMQFGRLTVIAFAGYRKFPSGKRLSIWKCKCECGNETVVLLGNLRKGATRSCGCIQSTMRHDFGECVSKHHSRKTRLYDVWAQMKKRCNNPHDNVYKYYGGKGVKVCQEWSDSFETFKNWADTNGYDPDAKRGECTIDRIDPFGNYEPNNCRWISMEEQRKNLRRHWKDEERNDTLEATE